MILSAAARSDHSEAEYLGSSRDALYITCIAPSKGYQMSCRWTYDAETCPQLYMCEPYLAVPEPTKVKSYTTVRVSTGGL